MTNKEKYAQLCEREALPLHAQAWWIDAASKGKEWDVIILENNGQIAAAWPYHITRRWRMSAILMPVHTQYSYVYIAPNAPSDTCAKLVNALEETCLKARVGWFQIQGFFPEPLLETLRQHGYTTTPKVTYRIEKIPSSQDLPAFFSENKRRQLRKAKDLQLIDLSISDFYTFQQSCWAAQGKRIDYSTSWAESVLTEVLNHGQGRLLAAQDGNGTLLASVFLAWDYKYAYYLLPSYQPTLKNQGAVAWLTKQALELAQEKGLAFDFEGSMIPSIASSYQQFGGKAVTYQRIEKFYNPFMRIVLWLRQHL